MTLLRYTGKNSDLGHMYTSYDYVDRYSGLADEIPYEGQHDNHGYISGGRTGTQYGHNTAGHQNHHDPEDYGNLIGHHGGHNGGSFKQLYGRSEGHGGGYGGHTEHHPVVPSVFLGNDHAEAHPVIPSKFISEEYRDMKPVIQKIQKLTFDVRGGTGDHVGYNGGNLGHGGFSPGGHGGGHGGGDGGGYGGGHGGGYGGGQGGGYGGGHGNGNWGGFGGANLVANYGGHNIYMDSINGEDILQNIGLFPLLNMAGFPGGPRGVSGGRSANIPAPAPGGNSLPKDSTITDRPAEESTTVEATTIIEG